MSAPLTDEQLLLKCRKLIAEKHSWPSQSEWRTPEFNQLSQNILEATGVGLSTASLNSLFGNDGYSGLPNSSTLNPIASYLGYDNWEHLKKEQHVPTSPLGALMGSEANRVKLRSMNAFYVGVVLIALAVLYVFFFGRK